MEHGHGAIVLGSETSGCKDLNVTQCYFYKTDEDYVLRQDVVVVIDEN